MKWRIKDKNEKSKLPIAKNRIVEDFMIVETSDNFDCFDLARTSKNFQTKVYGIKVALLHTKTNNLFEYPNTGDLISALELYQTVISF